MIYTIRTDSNFIYIPGDKSRAVSDAQLNLELGSAGSLTFTVPPSNPMYSKLQNRKTMVSVFRDDTEIFYGEVRAQETGFNRLKKVTCAGCLSFLADTIQPQAEYHDLTPRHLLSQMIDEHNRLCGDGKKFTVGKVTVTDANDSLYRYTDFETTYKAVTEKLVERLGGYLCVRHEDGTLYLDWLNLADIGSESKQNIMFGLNLLDYTENFTAENIATAVIPLGAEIQTEGGSDEVLKKYTDITSVNDGKNYIQSDSAVKNFGFVCAVQKWNDVGVPSNLLTKGKQWLSDNQFEQATLSLTAADLSLLNPNIETFELGDKILCIAPPYGMDRLFPLTKMTIPLLKPAETKYTLGETRLNTYTDSVSRSYKELKEDSETRRKVTNERIQDAKDNLTALMRSGFGGYKLTEYDGDGKWLRDLYMDTMDKDTATKVLQLNMNGIGGSSNGYSGPYNVGMTLDGQIYGDRIVAGSITAEKLNVEYKSSVEKKITDAQSNAETNAGKATDEKLKSYYTQKQIDTKFTAEDGKIEAAITSAETSANGYTDSKLKGYYTKSEIDVKEGDINASVEKKLGDYYTKSAIDIKENRITSSVSGKVGKSEFGTYAQQNYNSFLLGFNNSSKYVKITTDGIGLYDGAINDSKKRAEFKEDGNRFFRDGYTVGRIGTNVYAGDSSVKGLVFDLEYQGKFMTFAQKASKNASGYTMMLSFTRAGSVFSDYGVHLGCDFNGEGFTFKNATIKNVNLSSDISAGGYTTASGSIPVVMSLKQNSDGTYSWTYGSIIVKNGLITAWSK